VINLRGDEMALMKGIKSTYRVFMGKRGGEKPFEISWLYERKILKQTLKK
jgi:hypothetical protein